MRLIVVYLAIWAGQYNTLQSKPVVRLHPHQDFIPQDLGGDTVELKDAASQIQLPPPRAVDSHGHPWAILVRNLGPGTVTIVGSGQFHAEVPVNHSVSISATSTGYSLGR